MRILLVEDEAPLRETLAARLKREGYAVDAAADGDEPHALAIGQQGFEIVHVGDRSAADLGDDVARQEAKARSGRRAAHRHHDHALRVVYAKLVGDSRQDVRHARAVERVLACQVAYVIASRLRCRHQDHFDRVRLTLAHDAHLDGTADAARRQAILHGARVGHLEAIDVDDDVTFVGFAALFYASALACRATGGARRAAESNHQVFGAPCIRNHVVVGAAVDYVRTVVRRAHLEFVVAVAAVQHVVAGAALQHIAVRASVDFERGVAAERALGAIEAVVNRIQAVGAVARVELTRADNGELLEGEVSQERWRQLALNPGEQVFIRPRTVTVFPAPVE